MNLHCMLAATVLLAASTLAFAQMPPPSDGWGVYTFRDGTRYEGEFRGGERNGRGVYTFSDGTRYEGEFLGGKRNGRGVETYPNSSRYEGEFRDDKRNGQGVHTFVSGNRYEGEFRDDKRNGQGVHILTNGTRIDGEWRDDRIFNGKSTDAKGKVAVYVNGVEGSPTAAPANVNRPMEAIVSIPFKGASSPPRKPKQ